MRIKKLKNGDEESLEQFLSGHAETSMFLRNNPRLSGLEYKARPYHGLYLASFDDSGNINGVLAQYWNGNIMMQAPDGEVLAALAAAFREQAPRSVAGILGPADQAQAVMRELELSDADYATNRDEGLYALDLDALIVPSNLDAGRHEMVPAEDVDEAILTRWFKAYEIEALASEESEELDARVKDRVQRIGDTGDCWAFLVDGEPVSLSGFNARLPDIAQIGPVWTPPEHRSRGYARTLVALTLKKAADQGVQKAILFTDNPAAVKAYEAVGFKEIGSYRLALLKKPIDLKKRG